MAWQLPARFGGVRIIDDTHRDFLLRTLAISSILIALAMRYLYVSSEWRRSIVLEALSEVERALSYFRSSQERIVALEEAARAAVEAAELADQRYAAGLVDLLSVLDTQRTLFNIEEQLVTTKGELLNNFSNLYRALGGGWDPVSQELAAAGESDA